MSSTNSTSVGASLIVPNQEPSASAQGGISPVPQSGTGGNGLVTGTDSTTAVQNPNPGVTPGRSIAISDNVETGGDPDEVDFLDFGEGNENENEK